MTDETPLLEVRDLTKTYDNGYEAVKGVSFSLPAGKLVGLIGPNGCGKTTMMRCINKMHPITSGDVLIDGESVKPLTPAQVARKVSNVPAEMTASFGLTVFETVMLGDQHCHVLPDHGPQVLHDVQLVLHVEVGGGLVDQHQAGVLDEGLGDEHPLPFSR